jgi:hypothetical protein
MTSYETWTIHGILIEPWLSIERKFVEACDRGDIPKAKEMLSQGAKIDVIIFCYETVVKHYLDHSGLSIAVRRGHLDVVKFLAEAGANLNIVVGGLTALMDAFLYGDLACAQLLIDLGADPNVVTESGNILHAAGSSNSLEAVKLALKYCQGVEVMNSDGDPPWWEFDTDSVDFESAKRILS